MERGINLHGVGLYHLLGGRVIALGSDALDLGEQFAIQAAYTFVVVDAQVMFVIALDDLYFGFVIIGMHEHPVCYELAITHVCLFDVFAGLYAHELRHRAVHHLLVVTGFVGFGVRQQTEFNEFRISEIIQSEQVGTCLFDGRGVFLQGVFRYARHQFTAAVTYALVQVGVQVAAQGAVLLADCKGLSINHKLLAESVTLGCLVVSVHQVVDSHGLRAVLLTDPVGIRQVDTDRRCGVAITGKDSCSDDLGSHTLDLLFLVLGVGGRVVLKPLGVIRDKLRAAGSHKVFEVRHRLPCTGYAQRVGVGLRKTVDEIHTAVEVAHPRDTIFIKQLEVTRLVEGDEFVDHLALLVILGIAECLAQPKYDMLQRLAVQPSNLIHALDNLAFVVLDELRVQSNPQRLFGVVLMRCVPRLGFGLRHTLAVVVAGRVGYQIHTVLCGHSFWHNLGIEHHGQNSFVVLHSGFLAGSDEPLLAELRQELVLAVVMMNTVAEPHAFQIPLESRPILVGALHFVLVEVQLLARTTNAQVIPSVLVKQYIPTPQCCLAKAVQQ